MATRPIEGKIVLTADTDNAVRGAETVKQAYQQAGAAAGASGAQAAAGQTAAAGATDKAAQAADRLASEHQEAAAAAKQAGDTAAAAAERQAKAMREAAAAAAAAADAARTSPAPAPAAPARPPAPVPVPAPAPAMPPAPAPAPAPTSPNQPAGEVGKLTAAQEAFIARLRETADTYGKSATEVLRYRAAQMGVAKEAEASIAALEKHGKAGQVSAGQTAMAWQQLPLQMQDVAVSLAGGMNPLMVFMQQAPQIVGSFGGLKNTVAALATVFTPLRMLIGGTVAALGTLAVAALQGHQEQAALTKSLALTGGAAGVTAGQVMDMGTKIAAAQGVAVGKVRDTMQSLVDSGVFVGTTLASAGRAATALSKLTGASADEVAKDFSDMKSGVAAWAAEHNKSYNFLTADQYKYIRSLESQGRSQEAMRVALEALATTMEERSAPALGTLEKAWIAVGAAVSKAWDFMKGVGREESAGDRLARLKKAAEEAEAYASKGGRKGWWGETIDDGQDAAREARSEYEAEKAKQDEAEKRAKDRADKAQAEQKKIHQSQKQYQDLVTQGKLASDQKELADELKKQQALADIAERSFQRGEISAAEHAVRLNAIDQKRLELQLQNLRDRKTSEGARVTETPEDVLARSAAVKQLDAQIVTMQTQLDKAVSDGRNIVSANALQTARDRAQQWAAAWKAASDQVRSYADINAGTRAVRIADPQQRASAEAAVRTEAPRRQLADQQRELQIAIDLVPTTSPASKAELQRQLAELTAQGEQHIAELTRAGQLDSFKAQYQELTTALQQAEADIERLVTVGAISTTEAERRKFAERAKALPQLQALASAQRELAQTAGERNDANGAVQAVQVLADQKTEIEKSIRSSASNEFGKFFNSVTNGSKTAGQALRDMVGGFAQSMLDLISQRLGDKMLNSVLDAIDTKGAGGGAGGSLISTAASWIGSFFHDGGVVGAGGARTASFPAAMWSVAPRYHTGGIAGLKPNEVPAVLMAGEEVLTANDPRHKNNGGTMAARSMGPVSISISVTGAEGNAPDQAAAAQDLGGMMEQAVNAWATKQSRPGGVLWKGK